MTNLRLNIGEIVTDIKKLKINDLQVMEKYHLDHVQFVLVLGRLAEDKHISFRRMINVVNGCLTCGNLGKAEECLEIIEKNFPKASGVKSLKFRVENALEKKKSQDEYERRMREPSPSLEWLKSGSSNLILHPEIERMVKVTDMYSSKIDSKVVSKFKHLLEPTKRLSIITKNNNLFFGLSKNEANRMWHYLNLVVFAENGVERFFIFSILDSIACNICVRLASHFFPVREVRDKMAYLIQSNNFLPNKLFPSRENIDKIGRDKREQVCMQNDWYLPPYCDNCRCQILPSLW